MERARIRIQTKYGVLKGDVISTLKCAGRPAKRYRGAKPMLITGSRS